MPKHPLELGGHRTIALVSDGTGEIVGGRILIIASRSDKIDTSKYKSEHFQKLMAITYHFGTLLIDTSKCKSEHIQKLMAITYHFGTLCNMFNIIKLKI